jgi:hypothetical protein
MEHILLVKLIGTHPVKKFAAFCGTQKFIAPCTSAGHYPTLFHPQPEDVPSRNHTDKREEMNRILTKIGN